MEYKCGNFLYNNIGYIIIGIRKRKWGFLIFYNSRLRYIVTGRVRVETEFIDHTYSIYKLCKTLLPEKQLGIRQ